MIVPSTIWIVFALVCTLIATIVHGYPWGQPRVFPWIHWGWLGISLVLIGMLIERVH